MFQPSASNKAQHDRVAATVKRSCFEMVILLGICSSFLPAFPSGLFSNCKILRYRQISSSTSKESIVWYYAILYQVNKHPSNVTATHKANTKLLEVLQFHQTCIPICFSPPSHIFSFSSCATFTVMHFSFKVPQI